MTELHPSDERLVDLALNDLDSRDQDALTAHLALCDACRLRYSGIAESVDGVLAAAPSVAPPPEFTSAVLAAIGLDPGEPAKARHQTPGPESGADATAPWEPGARAQPVQHVPGELAVAPDRAGGEPVSKRRWSRVLLVSAAAAVIALLAGVIGTAIVLRSAAPVTTVAGAPFITGEGDTVGSVQVARYEGDGVLVISVDGPAGKTYDCRVHLADGSQQTLATWTLPPDGSAAWVVDLPEGQPTQMDLVTPTGKVWATAEW